MLAAHESKYTFVTVFYEDEYELLRLQARSIRLYGSTGIVEKIIVIDNSERPLPRDWKRSLLEDYGELSNLVEIVNAYDIAKLPWVTGWRTQQILKLRVAHFVSTKRYLLLDSKNYLIFPLHRDAVEAEDGRPRTHLHGYVKHPLRRHLEHVLAYYGLEPEPYVTRFTATATPFIMDTTIAREMMADLEDREGQPFEKAFAKRTLTEFFAYACFIIKSGRDLSEVYDFHQAGTPCIWEYAASQSEIEKVVAQALARQTPFFSIHRAAIAKLDSGARDVVARLWTTRSLFATNEKAHALLSALQDQYKKAAWDRPFWRAAKALMQMRSDRKPPQFGQIGK